MSTERPLVAVLIWFVLMLSCVVWVFSRVELLSDISLFLPEAASPKEELLVNELREGPASRLILMGIEGGNEQQLAESSRLLAEKLRMSDKFVRVENGAILSDSKEQRLLFQYRYLVGPSPAATDFTQDGLRRALEERLGELRSPVSTLVKRLLMNDPTGVMLSIAKSYQGQKKPRRQQGVWFSADGQRALLFAETHARGFDLDRQQEAVNFIRSSFSPMEEKFQVDLLLTGPGVYGVLSRDRIQRESSWLSALSMILVGAVILLGYRSARLLLAGGVPIGTAFVAGVTAVTFFYGKIHGITLAFGITLLGITIDYPIHLFSHTREAREPKEALLKIWPTLRLGAITTCLGFLAMMTAGFDGLAQLALFAVSGLLAAALATRMVLAPTLVLLGWPGLQQDNTRRWISVLNTPKWARYAAFFGGIGCSIYLIFFNTVPWENDLAALSPVPATLIAQDRSLRFELGAPEISHMLVLRGDSSEEVLQQSENLASHLLELVGRNVLGGFILPSSFLPSQKKQLQRREALPDADSLQENLAKAGTGLPFKPHIFKSFVADVGNSKNLDPLTLDDLDGTALGMRISSQLFDSGQGWLGIIPLVGVNNPEAIDEMTREIPGFSGYAINLREESAALVDKFCSSAIQRLGIGILLIGGVLAAGLRSPVRVLQVLVPVFLALSVDVTLLIASGDRLSLFHLVSLLLVAGITIDYSLFFNRSGDSESFRLATLHSLIICLASTISVFGLLTFSQIPVLEAIGKTVVFGVLAGFVMSMLLALPLRRAQ